MTTARIAQRGGIHYPRFVSSSNGGANGASFTLSQPAGFQAGDVGILVARASTAVSTPAGWTAGTNFWYYVYAGGETSISMSASGASSFSAALAIFRGVDNANPINAAAASGAVSSGTTVTSASATATAVSLLVDLVSAQASSSSGPAVSPDRTTLIASKFQSGTTRGVGMAYGGMYHAGQASGGTIWTVNPGITSTFATSILLKAA